MTDGIIRSTSTPRALARVLVLAIIPEPERPPEGASYRRSRLAAPTRADLLRRTRPARRSWRHPANIPQRAKPRLWESAKIGERKRPARNAEADMGPSLQPRKARSSQQALLVVS